MSHSSPLRRLALPLWLLAAIACQPAEEKAAMAGPLKLEELKNGTYTGFGSAEGPVTLAGGRWEGQPFMPGGATVPMVVFVGDFHLLADLDGDGAEEAAVLLAENQGGTGERIYLAVVDRKDGAAVNTATVLLGDRVDLRDGRIEGSEIVLDLVQAAAEDGACCPGDLVTRRWTLADGALIEGAVAVTGRLGPEVLAGTDWVLRTWTATEPAPAEPAVTLVYQERSLAGNAGCNQYTAGVTAGQTAGEITVGPAAVTRKMCPDPEMAVENRFLKQLAGVTQFSFMAGELALAYQTDGAFGVMFFRRVQAH
jgi:heat shock protein HslJ